ncbi:hypothetical protein PoB_005533100 [Plakobranchus ocellatus]|uniref:Uncharacterized protein n=1 Tax=Plakobranchus ocellatus TaxID=259542 RepID=A0AAV4C0C6_9GAST|nr:hypothetical protein PoB_005533100 [Plakobranchus ocellatus]
MSELASQTSGGSIHSKKIECKYIIFNSTTLEPSCIAGFSTTSEDSNIENEEEEFAAVKGKYVMPVYRHALHDDIEEDDNHDKEEGQEVEEAAVSVTTWREGTTALAIFYFTGTNGLQVQMPDGGS